ncbi:NUDIX hydrolase [Oceaniglobus trochenteri]|uniref:NUDIX hydrolase n=1 Tax=Oceaniglobus trochenteri TaxID=2763260 RepID=UPI001CFFB1A3|nr:NUDIX hydrolase [Oceaniglobus trochenteri]
MPDHPRLAALAVVLRNDSVLLVQRRNAPDAGLWGFPGGHVELGETALAAAERELHEETGVIARARRYLDNVDVIQRDEAGRIQFHFLLAAVLCDHVAGEPVAADDALAAAWVPLEGLHALPTSDRVDALVTLALAARQGEPD